MSSTAPVQRATGWAVPLLVLILGMFLAVLGSSIVNVAIPYIQNGLGVDPDSVHWVSTGYLLTQGVAVPLSGWLSTRLGLTRVFTIGLVVFTVATLLCGIAWDLTSLLIFRSMQATPGGILPVVALTLLYRLVPPNQIGMAMGLYGFGVILAPALGPACGGWLVQQVGWQWIFFAMVPLGVLAVIASLVAFPRVTQSDRPRFDLLGYVTIAAGLICLMLAADRGVKWGWTSYPILMLATASLLLLALFVVIELEVKTPLIDLRVFNNRVFPVAIVLTAVNSLGLFALLYYVPQFLLGNQDYQAFHAGLLLLPSALAMAVMAPFAGRLYDRFGGRWPGAIGLTIAAYGSFLLAGLTPDVPKGQLILWTTVRSIGVGLSMMPVMTTGIAALPVALVSSGSTMSNVALRVASSLGIGGLGGLLTAHVAQLLADRGGASTGAPRDPARLLPIYLELNRGVTTTAYANGFYLVGLITLGGAVLAVLLPSGRPAAAQRPAAPPRPAAAPAPPQPAASPAQAPAGRPDPERSRLAGTTGRHR
ncbi:MAG TPA: DHA2 family efflux MFS transporter permease subunit [Pseudonocardia sp.]|jgi:EmrB/QacA subfamily drug resistance transporter